MWPVQLLAVAPCLVATNVPTSVRAKFGVASLRAVAPSLVATEAPTTMRVIMKFGGSSVRDAERVLEVCKLVREQIAQGIKPHLVCSAMGKTTNNLLAAADRALAVGEVDLRAVRTLHAETAATLGVDSTAEYADVCTLMDECERTLAGVSMLGELSPRTRDRVVAFGERLSGRMVTACLNSIGVSAVQIESWDLGVQTDSGFGDAQILDECWPTIRDKVHAIDADTVGVITGFIGKDADGAITTLGRGGSDLTASLIGAAAGYDEVQVWKDVDGILSADPRVCPAAIPVPRISFNEAAELAYFGAKVRLPRRAGGNLRHLMSARPPVSRVACARCRCTRAVLRALRAMRALRVWLAGAAPRGDATGRACQRAGTRKELVQPGGTGHPHHLRLDRQGARLGHHLQEPHLPRRHHLDTHARRLHVANGLECWPASPV
jgi:hypothetical protein